MSTETTVSGYIIGRRERNCPAKGGLPPVSDPDRSLVRACLAGDRQAWESLIRRYERLLYSIPLRCGLSEDDAADVDKQRVGRFGVEATTETGDHGPSSGNGMR